MSTNIPKTHDFGGDDFVKALPLADSSLAETWSGRGLEAIIRQGKKGLKKVVKGRVPEDSSAPTD